MLKPSSSNDPLTGLPNRRLFGEYSEKLHDLAIRNNTDISTFFIDLDNFKSVNDQFGHEIGDAVICEIADLLRSSLRASDIIARIDGDEFVICLHAIGKSMNLESTADALVTKISAVNSIKGYPIRIGASIGAAFNQNPETAIISELVGMADKLMCEAKKLGKGVVVLNEL